MLSDKHIWMIGRDEGVCMAVRRVLEAEGLLETVRTSPALEPVLPELGRGDDEIVIIDLDPSPMQCLHAMESVVLHLPQTRFVALSEHTDSNLVMEAMNVGIRHFIDKATLGKELSRIIRRIHGTMAGQPTLAGHVVTVLSAGGGCGATTLAVNLAAELPRDADQPSLLIDLDNAYGTIASYLGLSGRYGLSEVLAFDTAGPIDPQLISTTALKYSDRLHALINPVSMNFVDPAPLCYDRLEPAINACKQAYPWVVVDAPRVPIQLAVRLAHLSRFTLIVGQLSVKDIHASRAIHGALIQHGVAPGSIHHVINRYRSRHNLLSLDKARQALGDDDLQVVKNDFSSAIESINLGQTLAQCAPRCGARRDIQSLAEWVATSRGNGHTSLLHV